MKTPISLLLFFCVALVVAQGQVIDTFSFLSEHYHYNMEEGNIETQNGNYSHAIKHYLLAGNSKGITFWQRKLATDSLNSTIGKWVRLERQLKEEETKQKQEALDNARLLYGHQVAALADNDLQNGQIEMGAIKAFHALDSLIDTQLDSLENLKPIPPSVYLVFGNAVAQRFKSNLSSGGAIETRISSSGDYLTIVGEDKLLSVWALPSSSEQKDSAVYIAPKLVFQKQGTDHFLSADVNPDGQLATAGRAGFSLYNLTDSVFIGTPINETLVKLHQLSDNRWIMASRSGKVFLWNASNGNSISVLAEDPLPFIDVQVSQDGRYAMARTMCSVYFGGIETGKLEALRLEPVDNLIFTSTLSQDGQTIIISRKKGGIAIWNNEQLRKASQVEEVFFLTAATNHSRDHVLLGAPFQASIGLVEPTGNFTLLKEGRGAQCLAVSPANKYSAFSVKDSVFVYNNTSHSLIDTIYLFSHEATTLSFSPTSESLLSIGDDGGRLILWDITKQIRLIDTNFNASIESMIFGKKGQYLFIEFFDGQLISIPLPDTAYHYDWNQLSPPNTTIKEVIKDLQEKIKKDLGYYLNQSSN